MTVIAWDGKTIAADKRCTNSGYGSTIKKIFTFYRPGDVLPVIAAFSGNGDLAMELLAWLRDGANHEKFPVGVRDKDCPVVTVVVDAGGLSYYERTPYPIHNEDSFWACGSGRDYALAAMYLGKTAREAVEVACHFDNNCGNGIDELRLGP